MNRDAKKKIKILILDSNAEFGDRATRLFTREGYRVKWTSDAKEALNEYRNSRCQIVLIDLFGEKWGLEVLESFRGIDDDAVFIALMDRLVLDEVLEALRMGVFDVRTKGMTEDELVEVINLAIKRKGLVVDFEKKVNLEIGKKIRLLRKERSLTLKQLANRTGLSISLLSQIERAKSSSSVSTLFKVAMALNVKLEYFFTGI